MTPAWCRDQADEIGPCCRAVIDQLLADRVVERLRAAQGVIGLCKTYGRERLESACRRALAFDDPQYRTVKTILHKGLDQVALCEQAFRPTGRRLHGRRPLHPRHERLTGPLTGA